MNAVRIAGMLLLLVLWLWLCKSLIMYGGGITLKNIFITVASGIIIFVPLWRRYIKPADNDKR